MQGVLGTIGPDGERSHLEIFSRKRPLAKGLYMNICHDASAVIRSERFEASEMPLWSQHEEACFGLVAHE